MRGQITSDIYHKLQHEKCIICKQYVKQYDTNYILTICNKCTRTCVSYDTTIHLHTYKHDILTTFFSYVVSDKMVEMVNLRDPRVYDVIDSEGIRETIQLNDNDVVYYPLPVTIHTEMMNNCEKLFDRYFKTTHVIFLLGSMTDTESIMWISNVPKDVIWCIFTFIY